MLTVTAATSGTWRRTMFSVLLAVLAAILASVLLSGLLIPTTAFADVTVGNVTYEGFYPSDVISTDISIETPDDLTATVEELVVKFIQITIPIVVIAAVFLIIYNAIRNIFVDEKDRKKMRNILKNIIVNFFFITFACVIVELIVYIVLFCETLFISEFFNS